MNTSNLFSREEALGGLPAQRANTLLYLIESRTAHLAARSRWALERASTEAALEERELAFVEAFALGKDPPLRPTIQHLERYAPQWAPLVPAHPALRAALAHLVGTKYRLAAGRAVHIRAALGLDDPAVQEAYQRQYQRPLASLYAPGMSWGERLRWGAARAAAGLESLPPFWSAFAITLTETVGAGILALPIAVAGIGPLPGLAVLLLMGLLNMLTVAAMAEALSRSGRIRGGGYFGGMVSDYLGGASSAVLSLGILALNVTVLLAYFVGFSTTLAAATGLPSTMWAAALLLVILYFLRRKEMNATIASALLVGFSGIALILLLSLLALPHVSLENLRYARAPYVRGEPPRPELLGLIFGAILTAYFGHLSMGSCARVVLRRDPSARSLIYGCSAAIVASMALYALWVVVVNGAVPAQALAQESGTALVPLASRVGPIVGVLGSVYVLLSIAMVSIHVSLGVFYIVRERLPVRRRPVVLLPRQRARLILRPRRASPVAYLALSYLGLAAGRGGAVAQFRLEVHGECARREIELPLSGRWELASLYPRFPELRRAGVEGTLEALDAHAGSARLRLDTALGIAYEGDWAADQAHLAGLLDLPAASRKLLQEMMRRPGAPAQDEGMTFSDLTALAGQGEERVQASLDDLVARGMVRVAAGERGAIYRLALAARGHRRLPERLWQAVEGAAPAEGVQLPQQGRVARWAATLLQREPARFFLSLSPLLAVFLLVEWQLLTRRESFAGPLSLVGVLVASLLGGIFPVLLVAASRRKGDLVPGVAWPWLGHPLVLGVVYAVYLASILLHGLVIWSAPVPRACALLVALGSLLLTAIVLRRGALTPRTVLELRATGGEAGGASGSRPAPGMGALAFAIASGGRPAAARVMLDYPEGEQCLECSAGEIARPAALRAAVFNLPAQPGYELKVWAHHEDAADAEGAEGWSCRVEAQAGDQLARYDLGQGGGQVILPPCAGPRAVKITFGAPLRA